MFNALQFVKDYNIDYRLSGKNISSGMLGVCDPFSSSDTNYHGAFSLTHGTYYSWHSGAHKLHDVIIELLGVSKSQAFKLIKEYSTESYTSEQISTKSRFVISDEPLHACHRNFLRSRGFNAQYLEDKYDLRSDASRLIIPVYYNRRIVSYQERDVRFKFYKSCPLEIAIMNNKDIFYNLDNVFGDKVVVVEGVFDVYRLGDNSVCSFGTSVTTSQIALLAKRFKKVIMFFDPEPDAQKKAEKVASELEMMGVDTHVEKEYCSSCGVDDPAELSQSEADKFMDL